MAAPDHLDGALTLQLSPRQLRRLDRCALAFRTDPQTLATILVGAGLARFVSLHPDLDGAITGAAINPVRSTPFTGDSRK